MIGKRKGLHHAVAHPHLTITQLRKYPILNTKLFVLKLLTTSLYFVMRSRGGRGWWWCFAVAKCRAILFDFQSKGRSSEVFFFLLGSQSDLHRRRDRRLAGPSDAQWAEFGGRFFGREHCQHHRKESVMLAGCDRNTVAISHLVVSSAPLNCYHMILKRSFSLCVRQRRCVCHPSEIGHWTLRRHGWARLLAQGACSRRRCRRGAGAEFLISGCFLSIWLR